VALYSTFIQQNDIISLHHDWVMRGIEGAAWCSAGGGAELESMERAYIGYGDLHSLLGMFGLSEWNLHLSLLVLFALGYWIYVHRSVDLWLLLGVAAIISRFWTYHRVYDDLLMLLPMIALFRIIKSNSASRIIQTLSGILLVSAVLAAIIPASLRLQPPPVEYLFKIGQTIDRIIVLVFFLYHAWQEKKRNLMNSTF